MKKLGAAANVHLVVRLEGIDHLDDVGVVELPLDLAF